MNKKKVLIITPGGQYNHLIYRKVIEAGHEGFMIFLGEKINENYDAIIIGGGPARLKKDSEEVRYVKKIIKLNKPILGICLGLQLLILAYDGELSPFNPSFGPQKVFIKADDPLFKNIPKEINVWESHNDTVSKLPKIFKILAFSRSSKAEIIKHKFKKIYGMQFHPEVEHTEYGSQLIKNFIENT